MQIDLDDLFAGCAVALTAGLLVLATYVVTMRTVSADIDRWHDVAVSSQSATAQCIAVLEGVEAELLSKTR